jgi:hypothetical protein
MAAVEEDQGVEDDSMSQERPRPENEPPEAAGNEQKRLRQRLRKRFQEHQELALWMRALLFLVGWLLVLVGIAGLVLPGIQGLLTLVAGAAMLSLVSEIAYKVLRWSFQKWPRGWRRVSKWRRRLRGKLVRFGGGRPEDGGLER